MDNEKEMPGPGALPIKEILGDVFLAPWTLRKRLFFVLLAPGAVFITIGTLYPYEARILLQLPILMLWGLTSVFFAVTCHRIFLLEANAVGKWGLGRWTNRETRFFFWIMGIYFIFMLIYVVVMIPTMILGPFSFDSLAKDPDAPFMKIFYLVAIPGAYVLARLSPVLPATAVDRRPGLSWVWDLSKGNGWRLTVVVVFVPWSLHALLCLLLFEDGSMISKFFTQLIAIVIMVFEVAALSFSYRKLLKLTGKGNSTI